MKIAGIMQTRNCQYRYKVVEQLHAHSDFVLVLDDSSNIPFVSDSPHSRSDLCEAVLTLDRNAEWNCTGNITHLMYHGHTLGADWFLHLDDDMVMSHALRQPGVIRGLIEKNPSADLILVTVREIYDSPKEYRGDWNKFKFAMLIRNWLSDPQIKLPPITHRYHSHFVNSIRHPKVGHAQSDLCLYHFGNMLPHNRQARYERYQKVGCWSDPNRKDDAQLNAILDETNKLLIPVPKEDIEYFPVN